MMAWACERWTDETRKLRTFAMAEGSGSWGVVSALRRSAANDVPVATVDSCMTVRSSHSGRLLASRFSTGWLPGTFQSVIVVVGGEVGGAVTGDGGGEEGRGGISRKRFCV